MNRTWSLEVDCWAMAMEGGGMVRSLGVTAGTGQDILEAEGAGVCSKERGLGTALGVKDSAGRGVAGTWEALAREDPGV